MNRPTSHCLGLELTRHALQALLVQVRGGRIVGQASAPVPAPAAAAAPAPAPERTTSPVPAGPAPIRWLDAAAQASREALRTAGCTPEAVVGVGLACDITDPLSCLPDGTPLAEPSDASDPSSVIRLHAADWLVWQLISGPFPHCDPAGLRRSTCLAGFADSSGAPRAGAPHVHAGLYPPPHAATLVAPGCPAGEFTPAAADLFGLRPGTPVSAAAGRIHACVPGAGIASPSTMLLHLDADRFDLLMNSRIAAVPPDDVTGPVEDGILPGYYAYQAETSGIDLSHIAHHVPAELCAEAAKLPPGADHPDLVRQLAESPARAPALRRFVAERVPILSGSLRRFSSIAHLPAPHALRITLEAAALRLRGIIHSIRDTGVPVRRFVASIPHSSLRRAVDSSLPLFLQILADILDARIKLTTREHLPALGAAALGALAAGPHLTGHHSLSQTLHAIAPLHESMRFRPDLRHRKAYARLFPR